MIGEHKMPSISVNFFNKFRLLRLLSSKTQLHSFGDGHNTKVLDAHQQRAFVT